MNRNAQRCLSLFTVGPVNDFSVIERSNDQFLTLASWTYLQSRQPMSTVIGQVVREMTRSLSVTPSEQVFVAVSAGPGSFTGIRLGIAAAQGLCRARGLGLYAVSPGEYLSMAYPRHTRLLLDGHNGYFAVGEVGAAAFRFIPYTHLSSTLITSKDVPTVSWSKDIGKVTQLLGWSPLVLGTLDGVKQSELLAQFLLEKNAATREAYRYAGPQYGLEAFTHRAGPPKAIIA